MAGQRSKIQEDVRFRVLRLLHDNRELSQRKPAEAVRMSNGSAHYLLSALLDKGQIKLGNFNTAQDKPRHAYILTPKGVAEKVGITKYFLERKIQEYHNLKAEIDCIRNELSSNLVPKKPKSIEHSES
jgi:EPS-associated MarR family transcriptional regulator